MGVETRESLGALSPWSPEFLAAIVESSDDAIIGKTLDGTIISWNRGAERIYGYRPEEAIGRNISILVPADHTDELAPIFERLRRGERVDHYQTVRVHKDGKRIAISVTISPVRDEQGKIIGASAVGRDITAQHEATKEALRMREEFISIAAHELRTPLATVFARLQLAERHLARPEIDMAAVLRDVVLVRQSADRLRLLVDRLLDISHISSGRLELEKVDTDVADLVRSVSSAFAETSGHAIRVNAPQPPEATRASLDAVRIDEVITNLLDNALKYGGPGDPIDVDVRADGAEVSFAVRDRGPGIAPDQRERIFQPFERGDTKAPGVGLGLHVAREIVLLHGGTIALEAPPDGGARFVVTLPKDGARS
ncbi:MAG: PAS domain S-box protein [Chloroflexi bacterium]|nr:MAG: PAS domain S-box protein [Chloroflexota bacterium]